MPTVDPLVAQFNLNIKPFKDAIAAISQSLGELKNTLDSIGSSTAGIEKATGAISRGSQQTASAEKATKSYIERLEEQARVLQESASAHLSVKKTQEEMAVAMNSLRGKTQEEKDIIEDLTRAIFQYNNSIREQDAETKQAIIAQTQYIEKLIQGKEIANSIQARAPTGGFQEFAVAAAAAIGQQARLAQSAEQVSAALTAEENKFAETSAVLKRNIAIYQEAIAAGKTYAQVQEQIAAANQAAQFSNKQHANEIQQLVLQERQLAAAVNTSSSSLDSFLSALKRIAIFTLSASVLVRGFYEIVNAVRQTVDEGIRFNATLEKGQIAIAGVLAATRQVRDENGNLVNSLQAFPYLLDQANKIQKDIILANRETLGTGEELQNVYLQVLSSTKNQKGSLDDILQVSKIIANIGTIRGQTGEKLTAEARQLLTLEREMGQVVLPVLGVSFETAKQYKEQGIWIQKIIENGKIWLSISGQLATTWEGLASTVSSFFSLAAAEAFSETFKGLKVIMSGVGDELQKAFGSGQLQSSLGLTNQQLRELGESLGKISIAFIKLLADMTNGLARFVNDNKTAVDNIVTIWGSIKKIGEFFSSLTDNVFVKVLAAALRLGSGFDNLGNGLRQSQEAYAKLTETTNQNTNAVNNSISAVAKWTEGWTIVPGVINKVSDAVSDWNDKVQELNKENETIRSGISLGLSKDQIDIQLAGLRAVADAKKHNIDIDEEAVRKSAEQAKAAQIAQDKLLESFDPKKINAYNKEVVDGANKAAQAEREYAKAVAVATGDVDSYRTAALAAVEANLEKEKNAHKLSTEAIADLDRAAVTQRLQVLADATEKEIEFENRRAKVIQEAVDAYRAQADAVREAADAIRSAEISALEDELSALKEHSGTYTEQITLIKQIGDLKVAAARNALDALNQEIQLTQIRIQQQQEEVRLQAEIYVKAVQNNDALGADKALKATMAQNDEFNRLSNNLTVLQGKAAAAGITLTTAAQQSAREFTNAQQTVVNFGNTIANSLDQVFNGLIQGTLKFKDVLSSFGLAIAREFIGAFAKALAAKAGFDVVFQNNLQGLGSIVSSFASGVSQVFTGLFGNAGSSVVDFVRGAGSVINSGAQALGFDFGSLFGNTAVSTSQTVWKSGWDAISNHAGLQGVATQAGSGFGSLFSFAAIAMIGNKVGGGIAQALGVGLSKEGRIGGTILSFLSPVLGPILGGFLGDLFAHIPTKGTQIRKAVVDYLKEIKTSFASELSSKNYFFEETKDLANQLFGGDFLAASQNILQQKAGPTLARQLQALGTFLTADQASKLGKSVVQTGTTFGNMLIANLGIDRIPDAIKEIIQKGNISFEGLTSKLTQLFKDSKIDLDFYKTTLQGAVDIFYSDLPAAINASKIALDSFKDGLFDLDTFKEKLKNVTDIYDLIVQQATEALKNNTIGEEAAQAFGDGLKKGLANLAIDQFLQKFFKENLFEGIDLSDGLDQGEIDKMRERIRAATEDVNNLRAAFDDTSGAIKDMVSSVATDVLQSEASGEAAAAAFAKGVQKGLANMAVGAYIQKFLKETLFEGIDLSDGLDQGEIDKMRARIKAAKQDVDDLNAAFGQTGSTLADSISGVGEEVLNSGKSGKEAGDAFLNGLQESLGNQAVAAYIHSFLNDVLFQGIDLSNGLDNGELDTMRDRIQGASDDVENLRNEFGLVGGSVRQATDAFMQHFSNIGSGLTDFAKNYKKTITDIQDQYNQRRISDMISGGGAYDPELAKLKKQVRDADLGRDLGNQIGDQIADAVTSAITDAIINEAIINAVVKPFTDKLSALVKESMADGVLSPEEQAAIANLGRDAANAGRDAANAIAPSIQSAVDAGDSIRNNSQITADQFTAVKVATVDTKASTDDIYTNLKDGADAISKVDIDPLVAQAKLVHDYLTSGAAALDNPHLSPIATQPPPQHARGGLIPGYGGGDRIPAFLEAGEYIIPKDKALKYASIIDMIMSDTTRHFANGGMVDSWGWGHYASGGVASQSGDTDITNPTLPAWLKILRDFVAQINETVTSLAGLKAMFPEVVKRIFEPIEELSKKKNLSDYEKQRLEELKKAAAVFDTLKNKVLNDFLGPIRDYLDQPTGDPFLDLKKEADELKKSLTDNADFLKKMGVNVDGLLAQIDKAFKDKLKKAIVDPIYDFINDGKTSDPFADLLKQFDQLRDDLLKHGPELKKLGIDVDGLLGDLQKAFNEKLKKIILDPIKEFTQDQSDPFGDLKNKFDTLRDNLLKHGPELKKLGFDVDKLLGDIQKSFNDKLKKIKQDALNPIDEAIKNIAKSSGNIGNLGDVFDKIGSAKTLADLEKLRDQGIDIIKQKLDKQTQLEKDASDKRIAKLKEENQKAVDNVKKQQSAVQELFQLRQKQLEEELQAVKQMRDVGKSLIQAAADMNLSDLSPATPQERFNDALKDFQETAKKAKSGDIEAAQKLAGLGQTLLQEAQKMFASSPAFQAIFKLVQETLKNVGTDLTGKADIQEKQLAKLNDLKTDAERIAELNKQLHLTGKESLQQLKNMDEGFQKQIDNLGKLLDAAIKKEEDALKLKLQALNDAAVKELQELRKKLSEKLDELIKKATQESAPLYQRTATADEIGEAIVRAMNKNPQQAGTISIPIQVVTVDGKVIADTVLTRLISDTSNGKIVINTKGTGKTGRF